MKILPDGNVEITNRRTGERKIVQPTELSKYGLSMQGSDSSSDKLTGLSIGSAELPATKTGRTVQEHTQALERARMVGDSRAVKAITADLNAELSYQKDYIESAKKEVEKSKAPDKADVEQAKKNESVGKSLDLLEKNLKEVEYKGRGQGDIGAFISGLTGGAVNPEVADYEALRKSMVGPLARTVSQEKGVLTDQDIKRAEGLLPKITDDEKVVANKIANLNALLGRKTTPAKKDDQKDKNKDNKVVNKQGESFGSIIDQALARGKYDQKEQQKKYQGNALSEVFFPRATKVARSQASGSNPSLNERAGVLGETVSNALAFVPGIGVPAKLAASGVVSGISNPEKDAVGRLKEGTTKGIEGFLLGKVLQYGDKAIHPFRTVGETRAAAIAEASGKKISGDKIISGLEKGIDDVSPTADKSYRRFVDIAKEKYAGKDLTVEQVVKLNTAANDAYTQAGKVGKAGTAKFNKALGDILKSELKVTAPEVAKANKAFTRLYNLKKVGGAIVSPRTIGGAIGGAGVYGLFKRLGL